MAKVTTYSCDFNPNLPQHEAHFMLVVKNTKEMGEQGTTQFDVCVNHVGQMMESALFSPDRVNEVACKRLIGVRELPSRGKVKTGREFTVRRVNCPECGDSVGFTGLHKHGMSRHNMTAKELKEKMNPD
jgi:hypothetical protein